MLILTDTDETIQVDLTAAITTNQLQCVASYRDTTATNITAGRQTAATNSTTAVNVVSAPAASTQRLVEYLSVYNSDTASAEVLISLYDGTALFTLFKCVLGVGERLDYQHGQGWQVFANNGAVKTSLNQGTSPVTSGENIAVLASSVVNNNAVANTMEDVTGLSFAVTSGNKYYFRFVIVYSVAATTTGARFSIYTPAATLLTYRYDIPTSATARTLGNYVAVDLPAATTTTSGQITNVVTIEGFIIPSSNGTVIARHASELSATAVTTEGGLSFVSWRQTA